MREYEKKNDRSWLVLVVLGLLLLGSQRPLAIINPFGGNTIQDEMTQDCDFDCPSTYEICVGRFGPDDNNEIRYGFGTVLNGGAFGGSIHSTTMWRCLIVGYSIGEYEITSIETLPRERRTHDCINTPADTEFCLIYDTVLGKETGYDKYKYVLIAESDETTNGLYSEGVDWLKVSILTPPKIIWPDALTVFRDLFSTTWDFIKSLLGL